MADYKFNITGSFPDPEEAQWLERDKVGISGDGHAIYPLPRKFQMRWSVMSLADFQTIVGFYNLIGGTGSAIIDLPQYGAPWNFVSYTGCILHEPVAGAFFEQYIKDVTLLIVNIIT